MTNTSRQVILVCEECGERTVLEGPLSVWGHEGSVFGCECGELLTPADSLEVPAINSGGIVTTNASIAIVAVSACLVALVACAAEHYLAASL